MGDADLSKTTSVKGNALSKTRVARPRAMGAVPRLIEAAVNQDSSCGATAGGRTC